MGSAGVEVVVTTTIIIIMVTKTVVVVALGLLAIVNRSSSLSCLPCNMVDCGPSPSCQYEVIKSVCGCCDACSKGPGERCGGPWGIAGSCSEGLDCQLDANIPGPDFNKDGVCVDNVQRDPCALPPDSFCTQAIVCGSDGNTYNNGCAFIEAKCRNPTLKKTSCARGI